MCREECDEQPHARSDGEDLSLSRRDGNGDEVMLGRKAVLTRTFALTAVVLSLGACGRSNSDLRTYIDEVKARPGGRIDALPTVHPAPTFSYEPGDRRSPFVAEAPQRRVSTDPNAGRAPHPHPAREM